MSNVSNIVKSIQDIMRKDAGTYGDAQRLEQLGWMFFLKIFDDREIELELLRDQYRSPLPVHLRWSNWATDAEGITGEALLDFVNNTLLPKLKVLTGGADKIAGLIRMVFEDANNYMKNGTLMRQVINKINGIDFNASDDRHMFGDIYEKLLRDLQSAGNAGEFYTPRAVTQFIVDQVNPRLGETLLDPACGTGGFLVCAIEHLRKQARTEADERTIQDCFAGIEKKHLPHVLCMTNLLPHGIDDPSNVRHDKTLARPGIGRHSHLCVQRGDKGHMKVMANGESANHVENGPKTDTETKSRHPLKVARSICFDYRAMPAKFSKSISSRTLRWKADFEQAPARSPSAALNLAQAAA